MGFKETYDSNYHSLEAKIRARPISDVSAEAPNLVDAFNGVIGPLKQWHRREFDIPNDDYIKAVNYVVQSTQNELNEIFLQDLPQRLLHFPEALKSTILTMIEREKNTSGVLGAALWRALENLTHFKSEYDEPGGQFPLLKLAYILCNREITDKIKGLNNDRLTGVVDSIQLNLFAYTLEDSEKTVRVVSNSLPQRTVDDRSLCTNNREKRSAGGGIVIFEEKSYVVIDFSRRHVKLLTDQNAPKSMPNALFRPRRSELELKVDLNITPREGVTDVIETLSGSVQAANSVCEEMRLYTLSFNEVENYGEKENCRISEKYYDALCKSLWSKSKAVHNVDRFIDRYGHANKFVSDEIEYTNEIDATASASQN